MTVTRIFMSGHSQAVRLPKNCQFDVKEVEIFRRGEEVVLRKPPKNLARAFTLLTELPDGFMIDAREEAPPEEREF